VAESRGARALRSGAGTWKLLGLEQRAAAAGALLLVLSTIGPFSFVEAAEILTAGAVFALLHARAQGKRFHLPLGDGTVIAAAGVWAGLLIVARMLDRPLGQNLLALACAALLVLAGLRERAKRPADDLPAEHATPPLRRRERTGARRMEADTDPLAPPEFELPARSSEAREREHPDQDR
jgi:hypothetical protein